MEKNLFTNPKYDNYQLWIHWIQVGFAAGSGKKAACVIKDSNSLYYLLGFTEEDLQQARSQDFLWGGGAQLLKFWNKFLSFPKTH